MKMFLFLNESNHTSLIDFVCGVLFYGTHVYSYAQNVGMPIIGCQSALKTPFPCLLSFRFRSKRKSEFRLRPSFRSLLSTPIFSLL
ncbi:CPA_1a_G0031630.mRNA.1.CDS.1 [Saccharomyces cerevisiae]|nr:CPA_1a_G0031630.mRNA.1.CDS.1 [Saccharomyces cerevisiae]CAI7375064.1 CPA_1a_G0031630.mRNA.1.CDS.1 [Saccharomyces cerevisiae]